MPLTEYRQQGCLRLLGTCKHDGRCRLLVQPKIFRCKLLNQAQLDQDTETPVPYKPALREAKSR